MSVTTTSVVSATVLIAVLVLTLGAEMSEARPNKHLSGRSRHASPDTRPNVGAGTPGRSSGASPSHHGYIRRTAGAPTPFAQVFLWLCVGTAAYGTFLWIPRKLRRQALEDDVRAQKKAQTDSKAHLPPGEVLMLKILEDNASGNDLLASAEHMHLALWIVVAFDMLVRLLSLGVLSERQLYIQQYLPLDTSSNTTASQREVAMKCWGLSQINLFRDAVMGIEQIETGPFCGGGEGWVAAEGWDPAAYMKPRSSFAAPDPYNVRHVTVAAVIISFVVWMWWTWRSHVRYFLAGALPAQQPVPKEKQYAARAPAQVISTRCVVALWMICYLSMFTYVKAMPVFMGLIHPGAVICVSLFSIFLP